MSVASTDLVFFTPTAANIPTSDSGTVGGGIDTTSKGRVVFQDTTNTGGGGTIECKSTSGSDTMNITVTIRTTAGAIVSETKALTGTTFINLSTLSSAERVLKAVLASNAVGTVTVRRSDGAGTGVAITQIEIGERGSYCMFYDSASDTAGGKVRYEKIWAKNLNGTNALTNATIALTAQTYAGVIHWGYQAGANDTSTNRVTAPATVSYITDATATQIPIVAGVAVAGTLGAGESAGVWIRQTLAQNDTAKKGTFTLQIVGTST